MMERLARRLGMLGEQISGVAMTRAGNESTAGPPPGGWRARTSAVCLLVIIVAAIHAMVKIGAGNGMMPHQSTAAEAAVVAIAYGAAVSATLMAATIAMSADIARWRRWVWIWHLSIEGKVRTLVVHNDDAYEEWGASASIRIDPGSDGRGMSLTITPTWGSAASEAEQLWGAGDASKLVGAGAFQAKTHLDTEIGYGLGAPQGWGVVTPYAGVTLSDGAQRTLARRAAVERLRQRHNGDRGRTPGAGRGCITNKRSDAARPGALLKRNQRCWRRIAERAGGSPTNGRRRANPPGPAWVLLRVRIPSALGRPRKVRTDTSTGTWSKLTMTGGTNQMGIAEPIRSIQPINGPKMT